MKFYRLVSEAEAKDIESFGVLRHPYGGMEVKEFWLDVEDALSYWEVSLALSFHPPYVKMIVATLNSPLLVEHEMMELDGRAAITVYGEALYRLNKIITLEWVNLGYEN